MSGMDRGHHALTPKSHQPRCMSQKSIGGLCVYATPFSAGSTKSWVDHISQATLR
jgi:hypothetical protein